MAGRFRKIPVEIEAVRWTGDNWNEISQFVYGEVVDPDDEDYDDGKYQVVPDGPETLSILTMDGEMFADRGDWVIREPFPTTDRKWYPCKPEIFDRTYEPCEEASSLRTAPPQGQEVGGDV